MKRRNMYAFLTALLMLSACTGCGSTKEADVNSTLNEVKTEVAADEEAPEAALDGMLSDRKAMLSGEAVRGDAAPAEAYGGEAFAEKEAAPAAVDEGFDALTADDGGGAAIDPPAIDEPPVNGEVGVLTAGE